MKNLFKKVSAILMAAIMVFAMAASVFAESGTMATTHPSENDKATLTITGIATDDSPTVTLYKIAKGKYSEKGFTGYETVTGVNLADLENPTEASVNTIAKAILDGDITPMEVIADGTISDGTYKKEVTGAGAYIAIITGATSTVYNPILLGVSYDKDSIITTGTVDATDVYASSAVAKSTKPHIDKTITGGTTTDGEKATVSVGDVVDYNIAVTAPSYPSNATNKTFFVADTMSSGLTFDFASLEVKTDADDVTVTRTDDKDNGIAIFKIGDTVIARAKVDGNGFNLSFMYDNLIQNKETGALYNVSVEYSALVNDLAVVGTAGNKNDAKLYYANNPFGGSTHDTPDSKPDNAEGVTSNGSDKTVYTYQIALKKVAAEDEEKVLSGAVFGIYSDKKCENLVDEITTNENGFAVSTAVAKGTYYVKELKAPTGYTLSEQIIPVDAQWTTATTTVDGTVTRTTYTTEANESVDGKQVGWIKDGKFYKEKVTDSKPAYVLATSETSSTSVTNVVENGAGTVPTLVKTPVKDTKLGTLPSTGGMGTYLFTIIGVVVMAGAAGAFFMSRRRGSEE
ncbi:SpaA isopeptide-forming pilin-related protein [Blautia sp. MSJ-36]|uniref:SpaA isopeptide-forming pilin-related protein n=1 Tax=Blautia sp. MSJ-36 TaxID=2841530 RepID=UPI001C0F75BF|nr:SpaA isopeptide-forming pilin-related protein [Blautia sp. MSJ-36]MBU5447229.1 LPXTG cell wall anchor domain-containing protein [Blautia sp. MSJ-36]